MTSRPGEKAASIDRSSREELLRKALRIEWVLLSYNCLEAAAGISFGVLAGSIALVGFGLDSVIECSSAVVLVWRLRREQQGLNHQEAEEKALRFVGLTFFLLAAYVTYESVVKLIGQEIPQQSIPGIVLACLSLILMPLLGSAKLRYARSLESAALRADAMETFMCAYLSFALLLGLLCHALWGLWWADPAAAFCMVPIMLREGWEGIRGKACAHLGS